MRRALFVIPVVLALAGCTTLVNKSYQKISVNTPGVENVDCMLETETNKFRMLAPGTVTVERAYSPLTMTCQKAGYLTNVTTLDSKLRMVPAQLNIFNGVLPGTAYDFASNSVYSYPVRVVVNMLRDPNRVVLPPREVHELTRKKDVVTARDVREAQDDDLLMGELLDDEADRAFSASLRK